MEKGIPKLYSKTMLELYKSPSNFGTLKNPTHKAAEQNAICGDDIDVQLIVKEGVIREVKFSGSGCVISLVSASLLTDRIKGMKLKDSQKLNKEDILKLLRFKVPSSRVECALLPLKAIKKI